VQGKGSNHTRLQSRLTSSSKALDSESALAQTHAEATAAAAATARTIHTQPQGTDPSSRRASFAGRFQPRDCPPPVRPNTPLGAACTKSVPPCSSPGLSSDGQIFQPGPQDLDLRSWPPLKAGGRPRNPTDLSRPAAAKALGPVVVSLGPTSANSSKASRGSVVLSDPPCREAGSASAPVQAVETTSVAWSAAGRDAWC
jgi:hypothetical protein